jgi:glycosyltransferase involved in cell wall biosynthesis
LAGSDSLPHLILVGGDGHPSGVPRHIQHVCAALKESAQITVVSDENHGGYDALSGAAHVTVPGLQSRMNIAHLWRGFWGLRRVLCQNSADIVWLHARLPVVFARVLLALRLWRPKASRVALTYHGLPFGAGHRPRSAGVSKRLERLLLRLCPPLNLVFLTPSQADRMGQEMGVAMTRHRVHVLPNSSDLGPLPEMPPAPAPHLVMTGRCGWQKNYPLALRVFAHLPEDYTLTLCGAGTATDRFQLEAAEILRPDQLARLRCVGPLSDVGPVLAAADGYLLTSRYEGLPIGALEAFEAGLPLILSRFEGAEDLAATHPMALVLGFDDLAADASQIATLITAYLARRTTLAADIRTAWAARWSYEVFESNARALVADLTDPGPQAPPPT